MKQARGEFFGESENRGRGEAPGGSEVRKAPKKKKKKKKRRNKNRETQGKIGREGRGDSLESFSPKIINSVKRE